MNPATTDLDTSILTGPAPADVAEAMTALRAALAAAPDHVLDLDAYRRAQPAHLRDAPLSEAVWFLHCTEEATVIHVGTRTVIVADSLIPPLAAPRCRPFLVA